MLKIMFKAFTVLLVFSFTACVSTVLDETIPLSKSFENSSELITYKKSNWKVGGKSFNQQLRNYSVDNAKVRWKKSTRSLADIETETNFINYLLFGDELSYITETYDVDETQRYSFNLKQDDQVIANAKCEIFSHSLGELTRGLSDSESYSEVSSAYGDRLETYTLCVLKHNNTTWELSLLATIDEPVDVKLESENKSFEIIAMSESILLKNKENGVEKIDSPEWLAKDSGLAIFDKRNKVSALSFVGKPKMWLLEDLSDDEKELLITVNYSLSMFNWLDQEWRETYL